MPSLSNDQSLTNSLIKWIVRFRFSMLHFLQYFQFVTLSSFCNFYLRFTITQFSLKAEAFVIMSVPLCFFSLIALFLPTRAFLCFFFDICFVFVLLFSMHRCSIEFMRQHWHFDVSEFIWISAVSKIDSTIVSEVLKYRIDWGNWINVKITIEKEVVTTYQ